MVVAPLTVRSRDHRDLRAWTLGGDHNVTAAIQGATGEAATFGVGSECTAVCRWGRESATSRGKTRLRSSFFLRIFPIHDAWTLREEFTVLNARLARKIRRCCQSRSQCRDHCGVSELFLAPPEHARIILGVQDRRLLQWLLGFQQQATANRVSSTTDAALSSRFC